MGAIDYRYGNDLDLDLVIDLYRDSTLGERLVGLSRTLTDFAYVGYLSDLAVALSHQRLGIGSELMARTRARMGPRSMLVLLAAPKAVDYYPRLGFKRHDSAWILRAGDAYGAPS